MIEAREGHGTRELMKKRRPTVTSRKPGTRGASRRPTNGPSGPSLTANSQAWIELSPPAVWLTSNNDGAIGMLRSEGCFSIPSVPLLAEFLKQYPIHIHPMLPLLDEITFRILKGSRDSCTYQDDLTLVLLQALLHATSTVSIYYYMRYDMLDLHSELVCFSENTRCSGVWECSRCKRSVLHKGQG